MRIHLNIIVYGRSLLYGCENFGTACREIRGGGEIGEEGRRGGGQEGRRAGGEEGQLMVERMLEIVL